MRKPPKSRLWTNADLREWFDTYNERYFGGELECVRITYSKMYPLGRTARIRTPGKRRSQDDRFAIHINRGQRGSRRQSVSSLLHEMVHLEQRCKYSCGLRGYHFNERMKKLAVAGAFNGIW